VDFGNLYGLKQMLSYEHGESDGWSANTAIATTIFTTARLFARHGDRLSVYAITTTTPDIRRSTSGSLLQATATTISGRNPGPYESDKDSNWMAIVDYEARSPDNIRVRTRSSAASTTTSARRFPTRTHQQSATQIYNLENNPAASHSGCPIHGPTYDPVAAFGSLRMARTTISTATRPGIWRLGELDVSLPITSDAAASRRCAVPILARSAEFSIGPRCAQHYDVMGQAQRQATESPIPRVA